MCAPYTRGASGGIAKICIDSAVGLRPAHLDPATGVGDLTNGDGVPADAAHARMMHHATRSGARSDR